MIAFTGLVFSITIVVLQLTSGQFSPRVLRAFLRDRAIQFALGVFVSTFVYAMVVQRAVTGSAGHHPFVPRLAVTGAFVLVLASVGLFIFYIHHVANMVRVATIVASLGAESRELLRTAIRPPAPRPGPWPDLGPAARVIAAPRPGVLVSVNEKALVRLAERIGCVVVLAARVGDYLPRGLRCCVYIPGQRGTVPEIDEPACWPRWPRTPNGPWNRTGVRLPSARGYRRAALSPAVNDPTTACQALDVLHDLLRGLAVRDLPAPPARGGRFAAPCRPQYGFADFVAWRSRRSGVTARTPPGAGRLMPCWRTCRRRPGRSPCPSSGNGRKRLVAGWETSRAICRTRLDYAARVAARTDGPAVGLAAPIATGGGGDGPDRG